MLSYEWDVSWQKTEICDNDIKKLASIMPKGAVLEDPAKPGVIVKKTPDKIAESSRRTILLTIVTF